MFHACPQWWLGPSHWIFICYGNICGSWYACYCVFTFNILWAGVYVMNKRFEVLLHYFKWKEWDSFWCTEIWQTIMPLEVAFLLLKGVLNEFILSKLFSPFSWMVLLFTTDVLISVLIMRITLVLLLKVGRDIFIYWKCTSKLCTYLHEGYQLYSFACHFSLWL